MGDFIIFSSDQSIITRPVILKMISISPNFTGWISWKDWLGLMARIIRPCHEVRTTTWHVLICHKCTCKCTLFVQKYRTFQLNCRYQKNTKMLIALKRVELAFMLIKQNFFKIELCYQNSPILGHF